MTTVANIHNVIRATCVRMGLGSIQALENCKVSDNGDAMDIIVDNIGQTLDTNRFKNELDAALNHMHSINIIALSGRPGGAAIIRVSLPVFVKTPARQVTTKNTRNFFALFFLFFLVALGYCWRLWSWSEKVSIAARLFQ
jgi:hypothetical protein